jgi:hypothetical protein
MPHMQETHTLSTVGSENVWTGISCNECKTFAINMFTAILRREMVLLQMGQSTVCSENI